MIRKQRHWLWLAALSASLGLSAAALAQSPGFQPFRNLFRANTAPATTVPDDTRSVKFQVELAWLADPITFPYYLEARVKGDSLEVHGYVPNKTVRSQAISLAKLNCPLMVVDTMREHPSLEVHPLQRSPEQLKSAAQTALREGLPGLKLRVQCQADGTVQVSGRVRSLEQKLKVSQALRRLHGCTSVANMTQTPDVPVVRQAPPAIKTLGATSATEVKNAPPAEPTPPKRGGLFGLFNKAPVKPAETEFFKVSSNDSGQPTTSVLTQTSAKTASPMPSGAPYETRGLIVVSTDEAKAARPTGTAKTAPPAPPAPTTPVWSAPKTSTPAAALSAVQLKKRIETAVPGVRNVTVNFTSKTDVRVECSARTDDSSAIAGQILSVPELTAYKVDLQIIIPDQK